MEKQTKVIYLILMAYGGWCGYLGFCAGKAAPLAIEDKVLADKLADQAVNRAFQTASSIRNLCEGWVYQAIKTRYPFPYNHADVKSYIEHKINLN